VDLLLLLLSSITELPVTKSIVLDSGMGKAVRDIEKHKICAGTPNEASIKRRMQEVKDAWNASVKVNKVVCTV
jgi:TFIIS helical bundle-like domain